MAIGHDQHAVARRLDDKTRAASLANLWDLELYEDGRVLNLIEHLLVDRLPPAAWRKGE